MAGSQLYLWQLEQKLHCYGHSYEARLKHFEGIARLKHDLSTGPADSSSPLVPFHCIQKVNHYPECEKLGLYCAP